MQPSDLKNLDIAIVGRRVRRRRRGQGPEPARRQRHRLRAGRPDPRGRRRHRPASVHDGPVQPLGHRRRHQGRQLASDASRSSPPRTDPIAREEWPEKTDYGETTPPDPPRRLHRGAGRRAPRGHGAGSATSWRTSRTRATAPSSPSPTATPPRPTWSSAPTASSRWSASSCSATRARPPRMVTPASRASPWERGSSMCSSRGDRMRSGANWKRRRNARCCGRWAD